MREAPAGDVVRKQGRSEVSGMKIAVCDDERGILEDIERRIRRFGNEFEIKKYSDGEMLLSEEFDADILFLDIQMPGRNGLEIAKKLRERSDKLVIIMISAAEEYVFRAFDVRAFHYLVKPLDQDKFHEVLRQAVQFVKSMEKRKDSTDQSGKTMMIKSGAVHTNVVIDDIVYAEVFNRKILLHTKQEELEYYGKLSDLENMAGDGFFRPHRAFLINMNYIVSYGSDSVIMTNGEIPISKAKHAEFVREYLKFHVKKMRG